MRAVRCPRKAGLDTASYVDRSTASVFYMSGYRFVMRYLRRDRHVNERPDLTGGVVSLSHRELEGLIEVGFAVGLVQFAKFHGKNYLCTAYGERIGEAAASNAIQLGAPKGTTVFCDAEWTDGPTSHQIDAFLRAWQVPVRAAGLRAGLYVGAGAVDISGRAAPTPKALAMLPGYRSYWRACSPHIPDLPARGYALWQCLPEKVHGIEIDQDCCHDDNRGARPYLMAA